MENTEKNLEIFPHANDNSHQAQLMRDYVNKCTMDMKNESLKPLKQEVTSNNHKKGAVFKTTLIAIGLGVFTYLIAMGSKATQIVNEEHGAVVYPGGGSSEIIRIFPEGEEPTAEDYWKEFINQVSTFGKGK